jgi:20S proteasome subunit alpha 6
VGIQCTCDRKACSSGEDYLEQHLDEFENTGKEDLIKHALRALRDCRAKEETELNSLAIGVVGINDPFVIIEGTALQAYTDP